jgi:ATP phosphoribosyltransferase
VSTGATLASAGLEIFGPVILESTAVLIGGPNTHEGIDRLLRRLRGVLVARKFVMVEYDLEESRLSEAIEIAGGIESPTVSPLRDPGWVAVRVMIPADDANDVMDQLADIGARAILVTAIHAARL